MKQHFPIARPTDFPAWAAGAGLWLLLLLTAVIFYPGTKGPFLFDDIPNLQNLATFSGNWSWQGVGQYLSNFSGALGRPLSALSFLVNDEAWPSDPRPFKTFNLLWHLLNGCLVFGFSRSLYGACIPNEDPRKDLVALLTAAIWLLNPIQISAIFLTVQRMTLLSGTFVIAGLWGYVAILLRFRGIRAALSGLTVLGIATGLATLCKENGALAPLLAWTLNATLLRKVLSEKPTGARRLINAGVAVPTLAMILVGAVLWWNFVDFGFRDFSAVERLLTESRVLFRYFTLFLVPRLSGSGLYNDDYEISTSLLSPPATMAASIAISILVATSLLARKKYPLFSFSILWFLVGHSMESTILPLELYFEHRNYTPLLGPAFAISVCVFRTTTAVRQRLTALGITAWLLLAMGISHLQAQVWGDWATLSKIWLEENPTSLRAHHQYADYLLRSGDAAGARDVFVRARKNGIGSLNALLHIIALDCSRGEPIRWQDKREVLAMLRSEQLPTAPYIILKRLRKEVEPNGCAGTLTSTDWLQLTDAALANSSGLPNHAALRMERANYFISQRSLENTMIELEAAYSSDNDPRIAFLAATLLIDARLDALAEEWLDRTRRHRANRLKAWLRNDNATEATLRAIIANRAKRLPDNK